jgi:peptidoglycan biosynthesis protein MviN/MurJ (putative lipid II flippase)
VSAEAIPTPTTGRASAGGILLDGLLAGALGVAVGGAWFLALDLAAGRPLSSPALVGHALLHRALPAAQGAGVAPLEVAACTAFQVLAFGAIGIVFSWLMTRFERFPTVGVVLLALFVSLQLAFFALDLALGVRLLDRLRPWSVILANVLAAGAMAAYLWKRHPRIAEGVRHLWDDEP